MFFKSPEYFDETNSKLTIDVIGKTTDGTKTGTLVKTASVLQ